MAIIAIFEGTLTAHNYRVGNLPLVNYFVIWDFWKFPKKITKIVVSVALKKNEHSQLEAEFATPEITLTAPNYRLRISNFEKKNQFNFQNFFKKKSQKNVMSGKLQGFEQSYLEAKFTTPESTLKAPHYRDGNFKFYKKNYTQVLLKKILKNDISRKVESFEQTYSGKICNLMRVPSQIPITGLRSSKFWTFLTSIFFFFENFGENHKKRNISKTTRIWAVIFGGKNCNSWEYPDRASPPRWKYQILWFFYI